MMTISGRTIFRWAARAVGAIIVAVTYVLWQHFAEMYEMENGVVATYRLVVLVLVYYLIWVFTRQSDNASRSPEKSGAALFALIVCAGIAAGFFATQVAYVEAVDRSASVFVAKSIGFIVFMIAATVVIEGLKRITK